MKEKQELIKEFKKLMIDENLRSADVAQIMGTSKQTTSYRINNFIWNYYDLASFLNKIGYDVVWVKREQKDKSAE